MWKQLKIRPKYLSLRLICPLMKNLRIYLISLCVIVLDQAVKLAVHYNMDMGMMGEVRVLGDVFKLHYVLNPGMAFGVEFGSNYGKIVLTSFRLVAIGGIGWYLYQLARKQAPMGFLVCMAMILGGAVGNVVDSVFYGVWLDNAPYGAPTPWFNGQVVDMFYLDIWEGILPQWIPVLGGQYYSLWPIFNVADASIFCGVAAILIFQKRFVLKEVEV
jgi:signal peptidase II